MKNLFIKLFEMSHFNTGISITPFSIAHIVYLVLIFGSIVLGWLCFRGKTAAQKEKLLRALAYALVISYISDFFFHEFVYGGLNSDKLPFHICTVLCPLVCFAQFNRNGHKLKEPVAILSVLSPMMYLCYPASVGTGEPWCYQAVQTMFFHGVLMAWGILNIALGEVKPDIRKCWHSGLILVGITFWAKLGNTLFTDRNWFFLEEDALYIGLVANGIIPKWSLMIINPIVFFIAVLAVYGVCCAVRYASKKKAPAA
ncbi:MAG: YwaF family protein [Oscillospiraceae bacterium]|nr:YwaF family protein [Oscillospiraceae bacterium]